jgi:hypothetical protein
MDSDPVFSRAEQLLEVAPLTLLATWIHFLGYSARGYYPQALPDVEDPMARLCGINEVILVLSAPLLSIPEDMPAYPVA